MQCLNWLRSGPVDRRRLRLQLGRPRKKLTIQDPFVQYDAMHLGSNYYGLVRLRNYLALAPCHTIFSCTFTNHQQPSIRRICDCHRKLSINVTKCKKKYLRMTTVCVKSREQFSDRICHSHTFELDCLISRWSSLSHNMSADDIADILIWRNPKRSALNIQTGITE